MAKLENEQQSPPEIAARDEYDKAFTKLVVEKSHTEPVWMPARFDGSRLNLPIMRNLSAEVDKIAPSGRSKIVPSVIRFGRNSAEVYFQRHEHRSAALVKIKEGTIAYYEDQTSENAAPLEIATPTSQPTKIGRKEVGVLKDLTIALTSLKENINKAKLVPQEEF